MGRGNLALLGQRSRLLGASSALKVDGSTKRMTVVRRSPTVPKTVGKGYLRWENMSPRTVRSLPKFDHEPVLTMNDVESASDANHPGSVWQVASVRKDKSRCSLNVELPLF
jgi:hypothetical protein